MEDEFWGSMAWEFVGLKYSLVDVDGWGNRKRKRSQ